MKPGTYSFTIYRHVSFGPLRLRFKDGNGDAVPLTGLTPKSQARKQIASTEAVDLPWEVTDEDNGEVTLALTLAEAQTLPAGEHGWDLVFERVGGERTQPFVIGKLVIAGLNTQPAAP